MINSLLPAGLGQAGDNAPVGQLAQTDAAEAEFAEVTPGAAATATAMISPGGILRCAAGFDL